MIKKILFLTGTRADFGKLKPLMKAVEKIDGMETYVFVTGMHLFEKYGSTGHEVVKSGFKRIHYFINQRHYDSMDTILANTIYGLGNYLSIMKPDLIVIHGDRVESLAGAIVGALNNILVAHIEGGEVSGTIDESIRHAASKLAHVHFVSNGEAKRRLIQMGEKESNIYVIGSPDIDLMVSKKLPLLEEVKKYYEIDFDRYAILIYHPVTTNLHNLLNDIREVIKALVSSGKNYVVVYPNNDPGADIIIEEYQRLDGNKHFKIFPSIRFEYFLVLLKYCKFIIGNSSAGIREAPFYGIPTVNIGSRQNRRLFYESIINVNSSEKDILAAVRKIKKIKFCQTDHFGDGGSTKRFVKTLKDPNIWKVDVQKHFLDTG